MNRILSTVLTVSCLVAHVALAKEKTNAQSDTIPLSNIPSAKVTIEASFHGLGGLPGRDSSQAYAVSADGSFVVGLSGREAFRWSASEGMINLGVMPGSIRMPGGCQARAVSADGSVVVGYGYGAKRGFRWTISDGMVDLGDLPGGNVYCRAYDVSADGLIVIGASSSTNSGQDYEAFHWTHDSGMVGLGDLPGGKFNSYGQGVSANGSVVVGSSDSASGPEAFRWTQDGGMVGLGDLPGGELCSRAFAVSADGSTVVGSSISAPGEEAFRWTKSTGMQGLGDLPGGEFRSSAWAVSADGSIVVGTSTSKSGMEAFIWDANKGMRSLKSVLEKDYGLDLSGWTLRLAKGISDDGLTIVGFGKHEKKKKTEIRRPKRAESDKIRDRIRRISSGSTTEGWIATIPRSLNVESSPEVHKKKKLQSAVKAPASS